MSFLSLGPRLSVPIPASATCHHSPPATTPEVSPSTRYPHGSASYHCSLRTLAPIIPLKPEMPFLPKTYCSLSLVVSCSNHVSQTQQLWLQQPPYYWIGSVLSVLKSLSHFIFTLILSILRIFLRSLVTNSKKITFPDLLHERYSSY